jgi:DNA-directed RNA polymerase, mitochondrial
MGKNLQNGQGDVEAESPEFAQQWKRETAMAEIGVKRYLAILDKLTDEGMEERLSVSERFLWKVMSRLEKAVILLQKRAIKELGSAGKPEIWVPLVCIDAKRMAYLTARCAFVHRHSTDEYDSAYEDPTPRPVLNVALEVARQIVRERQFDVRAQSEHSRPLRSVTKKVDAWIKKNVSRIRGHRKRKRRIAKAEKALGDNGAFLAITAGGGAVHAAVLLLAKLVAACPDYFSRPKPNASFVSVKRRGKPRPQQHVVLTEQAQQMLDRQHEKMARPFLMPMLYPPRDWQKDPDSEGYIGGYLHPGDLRLLSGRSYLKHTRAIKHPVGQETLNAVNAVQATKWRINRRVAEVLRSVAESEHRVSLGLGPCEQAPQTRHGANVSKGNAHRQITVRLLDAIEEDEDRQAIWFPHHLDFRGRMYSYPQDLNYQASDCVRSCLEFAEGKPLGPKGKSWLKRQLSASRGGEIARLPLQEQFRWVDAREQEILRLANDPLEEIGFWKKASHPWRFLAVCCEWAKLHHHQGSEFRSHLPVTMDGRCNGLQHLAALAGDPALGELVHITPSEGEASLDVYQVIANKLRESVQGDTETAALAWLKGDDLISRETVKHAVMTFSFGVTLDGLIKQILKTDAVYNIPGGNPWKAAEYLAKKLMDVTGENGRVLSHAKAIMVWLSEIAKEFTNAQTPMTWTNPAGMKIRLAHFRHEPKKIELHSLPHKVSITYRSKDKESKLLTRKQRQGITASIVHSFDAAHLAKTVNACVEEGIDSFAVIHDSYGTHACDADTMATLLREQFVEIYSRPWLKQLAERWRQEAETLSGVRVPDPPTQGDLDISRVTDSETFFC